MTTSADAAKMTSPNQDLIDAYLAHLAAHGYPDSTITTYRYPLQRGDRELPGGIETYPEDLDAWLSQHAAWSTRATYRAAFVGFYRWAVEAGRLDFNPAAETPAVRGRRRLPRPTSHDQTRLILTRAREPYRLWSTLMAYAGLRCIEIARLRIPDDITEQVIYVHGKGDRERIVPTHPDIWAAVAELKPGLLASGAGRKAVSANCNREYARLGLTGVTAHRLRHWFGTYAQQAGGDVRVTQRLMGHSNVTTTEVYTLVSQDGMRSGVLGLPRLLGG